MADQKSFAAAVMAGLLIAGLVLTGPVASAQTPQGATAARLFAREPVSAGIAVSQARFADGAAESAALSRSDAFPDSLAGSALTREGPLLFTRTDALAESTRAELHRVLPQGATVFLLGGANAISEAVADTVRANGYRVVRLGGPDRIATALAVADEVLRRNGTVQRVLLARSAGTQKDPTAGWADSVTAGGVAARDLVPLLLTASGQLDPRVAAWLSAHQVSETVLLGGTAALSAAVESAVPGPRRLAGVERTATAVEVARALWPSTASLTVTSARHVHGWALGLAAGGLAADDGAPLLLVEQGISEPVRGLVASCGSPRIDTVVVGDGSVVNPRVREALDAYDGKACGPGGTISFSAALQSFDACGPVLEDFRAAALERVGPYGLEGEFVVMPVDDVAGGDGAQPAPTPDSPSGEGSGGGRSGSNLQEAGVDEPDIVKDDGTLAVAVARERLQVVELRDGDPILAASAALPEGYDHRLFLSGDTLVVLSRGAGPVFIGEPAPASEDRLIAPGEPYTPTTVVTTMDLSDPASPQVLATAHFDGDLRSARMVGSTVRLVLQSSPHDLAFTTPSDGSDEAHAAAAAHNRDVVRNAPLSAWLPGLRVDDGPEQPVLDCAAVSRPPWQDGLDTLAVVTFEATDPTPTSSAAVIARGDTVYASTTTLVVSTSRWQAGGAELTGEAVSTELHAFAIDDPSATRYVASGSVPGYLLNQFSLSEQDGRIRVATTTQAPWWSDETTPSESAVRVLAPQGSALVQIGAVGGLGLGERIFAVRFLGDLAAVVTFRQIDPLYLIDLSDPTAPRVTGELKIPGFSSYLHRVGPDLLLGVGQDATDEGATTGLQVSLFDIADRSAPQRVGHLSYPDTYSEVEYDHLAFLHWEPAGLAVVPFGSYTDGSSGALGLGVQDATLVERARLSHQRNAEDWESQIRRSFVVGGTLYTLSERGLEAASLTTLAEQAFVEFG